MTTDPQQKGTLCIITRKHPCLLFGESLCAIGMKKFHLHEHSLPITKTDTVQSLKTVPCVEKHNQYQQI